MNTFDQVKHFGAGALMIVSLALGQRLARARRSYRKEDVRAGREHVKAYVEYVHFVEAIYAAASGESGEHATPETHSAAHEHH